LKSKTDKPEPRRAKLRSDNAEPNVVKSNTDKEEPSRTLPITDSAEPYLANGRKESESLVISISILVASAAFPTIDKQVANLTKLRTDNVEPK